VLLSDRDLTGEIKAGNLVLDPFEPELLQPSSIDVRLDRLFRVFNNHLYTHIDPSVQQDDLTAMVEVAQGEPFILHPGEFVLGSTLEVITLGDQLAGRLEGKSSLGRLGLLTHSTAGFIDPGFSGHVTLELSNVATLPIKLWPGMKIGQLCIFRLSSPAENPYGSPVYGSRYQGQRGPTPSRAWQNWRTWPTRYPGGGGSLRWTVRPGRSCARAAGAAAPCSTARPAGRPARSCRRRRRSPRG
jgi:dCTP deaminase